MVENLATHRFHNGCYSAGALAVGWARGRITARVIMREHETVAAVFCYSSHDFEQWGRRGCGITDEAFQMKAFVVPIYVRHPKVLHCETTPQKAVGEELARRYASLNFAAIK